jgi:hypothetical protein
VTGGRRSRAADDTGASLILALALVTFLGLVVGGLLSLSSGSLRATKAASGRATASYGSDGALKAAINQVRNSNFNNDAGQACSELTVPQPSGPGIRVTCTAAAGSGAGSERVPINGQNTPAQAVLTLGTNPGELGIAQKSNNELRVQGKVFSNGAIDAGPGALHDVNAQVVARGTCAGMVISSDAAGNTISNNCSAPASAIPADPDYPQPTAGLVYRPLPTCDSSSTVEFSPGYYDDAVGLSAMMNGTGSCTGKTFHFRPADGGGVGVYYFDFHNGEGGGLPTGARVWTISDMNAFVVGGTPRGWVPDVSAPAGVPGSCVSPLDTTANDGVRFVFGGDSRISLMAGSVELCGQYSATAPPITIHGAKTGADTVSGPLTATTDGTGTVPIPGPTFANPERITATDGSPASVTLDASISGDVTARVVVKDFLPATPVPAGSILTAAQLVVVHRDNNYDNPSKLTALQVTVTPNRTGATALTGVPQPTKYKDGPTGTAYHTDTLDLLASLGTDAHLNGFTGLTVGYDATVAHGNRVTENLDSIRLVLSWRPPAVRGEATDVNGGANCIVKYPLGCNLLSTGLNNTALYVQGTTYAPYAAMDINLTNTSAQVFRSGLVVRALQILLTASTAYGGSLIEIPNDSFGPVQLDVYFRAYLGVKVVGTARVRFPATEPTVLPTPGHRNVSIVSWTIRRN